jgi:hypothetical protein
VCGYFIRRTGIDELSGRQLKTACYLRKKDLFTLQVSYTFEALRGLAAPQNQEK